MIDPLIPPKRKNPLKRTRLPTIPAQARSRSFHGLTKAAAQGRFMLQRCEACLKFSYPPRDLCDVCLSDELIFVDASPQGTLLSDTLVRVPGDVHFRERAPWRIGLIKMQCGPTILAHLHDDCEAGRPVLVSLHLDKAGHAAAFARAETPSANAADDPQWRELNADPKFRRVLITNGRAAGVPQLVEALRLAGSSHIFIGVSDSWKPLKGKEALTAIEGVEIVPLDATDEKATAELAADIGAKVDILINTSEYVRIGGLLSRHGMNEFRAEIENYYVAFAHLAQAFGPIMKMRGADGTNSAAAWVNMFSVYALTNWPMFGAHSAIQAACLSLSHCLRAELRGGGIRVINLFSGPTESEWFQQVHPPKVNMNAVATALIRSLRDGLEDVFVGDVAEDIRRRLSANPKAVERELGSLGL